MQSTVLKNNIKLSYSVAEPQHIKLVYLIRDHEEVRCNLINDTKIDYADHIKYYRKMLEDKNEIIYIVYINGTIPIGFFNMNVDRKVKEVEIGFKLYPRFQGKGFGRRILNRVLIKCKKRFTHYKVILSVFESNKKALRIYNDAGFRIYDRQNVNGKTLLLMKHNTKKVKRKI